MNAVVLAGGIRSGLEVPGSGLPRALWPFPGEPLIAQVLRFLVKGGCQGLAICANGKTRLMAEELSGGARPWAGLHYSEDPLPRGPAGCLRDLRDWAGEETIVAIQGTGWYDFDLGAMVEEHRSSGAAVTVGARESADGLGLEPAGVYLVEPRTLELISPVGYQDFKEQFVPKVMGAGLRVQCHRVRGEARLIHSVEHYLAALGEAIERAELTGEYQRRGEAVVHETAKVAESSRLSGAVWVEAGAVVEEGCMLARPVVVGAGARVGAGAVVRRAVVMRGGRIEAGAVVESSVVGPEEVRRAAVRGWGGRGAGERGWRWWGGRRAGAGMRHAEA